MLLGKRIRLERIIDRNSRRTVIVPMDHGVTVGPIQGLVDMRTMVNDVGCHASDILAGIGPSIGPCCYEVGEEVADAASSAFSGADGVLESRPNGRWHLDLWAANRRQLASAGVRNIEVAGICTACRTDEWFSHRAERGKTGRLGALIGLARG